VQKDLKSLVDRAKEQGWTDKPVKGGLLLLAPDGVGKVTVHYRPGGKGTTQSRLLKNVLTEMRRQGFREES
jgi:hypothetical protein